jgi:hypothetical protein
LSIIYLTYIRNYETKEIYYMEEKNLKLAQQDIDEALKAVEDMEKFLESNDSSEEVIREKFLYLSVKVQELESILKSEGIL